MRALVGLERLPPAQRGFPLRALRRMGAALDVVEGLLVRRDEAGTRATLDRHVADGHAAFHGKVADRLAAILDDIAGAAGGTGRADDGKRDVLGGDAGAELAGDLDLHVLALALDQRLGGEHMLNLRRADPMREGTESSVRGGVAVTADHGHARQGPALFRPDDMHDALTDIVHRVVVDAEILGVPVERLDLDTALLVLDPLFAVERRGHVVVRHRDGLFRRTHGAAGHPEALEGLGARHLMDEVAIDIEQAGAVVLGIDDVGIPDLVIERLGGHRSSPVVRNPVGEREGPRSKSRQHGHRRAEEPPGQSRAVIHVEYPFHGRCRYTLPPSPASCSGVAMAGSETGVRRTDRGPRRLVAATIRAPALPARPCCCQKEGIRAQGAHERRIRHPPDRSGRNMVGDPA